MKLLAERCPETRDIEDLITREMAVNFIKNHQSATCCGCLEPLDRHGPFKRIGDLVFHGDECWRLWKLNLPTAINDRKPDMDEDEEPLSHSYRVRCKFSMSFVRGHGESGLQGPTIAEFLKLLRLE